MHHSHKCFTRAILSVMILAMLMTGCSDDSKVTDSGGSWAWKPLGDGINGNVFALQEFNGKLYAGGNFNTAGGEAASYIAAWDGSQWSSLGSGTSWPVWAMTIYDDKLIVGGSFGSAGGMVVNHVAAYDGTNWSTLGNGIPGDFIILDLCAFNDTLFAVGSEGIGDNAKLYTAAWDGSTWASLEPQLLYKGQAKAACLFDNRLYVGGEGEYYHNHAHEGFIKAKIGGGWLVYDSTNLTNYVHELFDYNNKLFVGGTGHIPVKSFSNSTWKDVGSDIFVTGNGASGTVRSLCEFGNYLVAGGEFISIGNDTLNHISLWNGYSWLPVGDGITAGIQVFCLTKWQDKLYVGGQFTEAGGVPAINIAEVGLD